MKSKFYLLMQDKMFSIVVLLPVIAMLSDQASAQCTYYADIDGDLYGDPQSAYVDVNCNGPIAGFVVNDDDCNDADAAKHPNTIDLCNNSDDDCDGQVDEDGYFENFFYDADGDGRGNFNLPHLFCGAPDPGYVDYGDDCDDSDPNISPLIDTDGDGYSTCDNDCDDTNPAVHPGANDLCNDYDDDCDAQVDEDAYFENFFYDEDGDGRGNFNLPHLFCGAPDPGYVDYGDDCDDSDPNISPLIDADGDGYSTCDNDCDDMNPAVHPGANDLCNDYDDNCDGQMDEDAYFENFFYDADGDGRGDFNVPHLFCGPPDPGYVDYGDDCDDTNPAVYPGAPELCDGLDNNCMDGADEGAVCCTGFITYGQGAYGNCSSTAGIYMMANFDAVFPGDLTVGCNKTLTFNSAINVCNFLPSGTKSKVLTTSSVNPSGSLNNNLAAQVVTLKLTLAFDAFDEGFTPATGDIKDLYIVSGIFAGMTVQQVFNEAEKKLGGCTSVYSVDQLQKSLSAININYENGNDKGYLACTSPGNIRSSLPSDHDSERDAMILNAYPNPSEGKVNVEFTGASDLGNTFQLIDFAGRIVWSQSIVAEEGDNNIELNFAHIVKGIYLLSRSGASGQASAIRIVIN